MADMSDPFEVLARSHVGWNAVEIPSYGIYVTVIQERILNK
jgi:hypothetical protein